MSELLDAFDDAGLVDRETREFLVEALSNAEADDWGDILEPWLCDHTENAVRVLSTVPGVIARSQRALVAEVKAAVEVNAVAEAFLRALPGGVLAAAGLHAVARCAQVCRVARVAASEGELWRRWAKRASLRWGLPLPARPAGDASWRDSYFSVLRPRCDGIYVGECRFRRWVRVGHHMDLRKNAEALAAYGGRGGTGEWLDYRRYVRLLPPDPLDGSLWALLLQDHCPREAAERVLAAGVDFRTHTNPVKSEGVMSEGAPLASSDVQRVTRRLCVGRYTFSSEEERVEVKYVAGDGEFHLTFKLSHGGPRHFSDRLEWVRYTLTDDSEAVAFDLGRLPEWKGGGLSDENKEHFPQMDFRPKASLEHLL